MNQYGLNLRSGLSTAACALACFGSAAAFAGSDPLAIDFEENPAIETGPSLFRDAGPQRAVTADGRVTVNGGVVLGFPTNFPAVDFATSPNVYGTASKSFDPMISELSPNITIDIDSDYTVNRVEGLLFNGVTSPQDYRITALSNGEEVTSQFFEQMPANLSEGNVAFSLISDGAPITQVVFEPEDDAHWDYIIDTLAFNLPIAEAVNFTLAEDPSDGSTVAVLPGSSSGGGQASAVPTPAALPAGLALLGVLAGRRRRETAG